MSKKDTYKFVSEVLQTKENLLDLIESMCKHCWPQNHSNIFNSILQDYESGIEWNGCMQGIEYHLKEYLPKNPSDEIS